MSPANPVLDTKKTWQTIRKNEADEGRVRAEERPAGNKLCPAPLYLDFLAP